MFLESIARLEDIINAIINSPSIAKVVGKLRYPVEAMKRQSTSTLSVERISKALMREDQIEFVYVKSETLFTPKDETLAPQYLHIQQSYNRLLTGNGT